MDWQQKNVAVYDASAKELSDYFSGIGSRVEDIEQGLKLIDSQATVRAVEIGCGDGRDAVEIVKRVDWYEGVDPSEGLLAIARDRLPNTPFVQADALSYSYPTAVDIIFAFASLLHVPKDDLEKVFTQAVASLRPDGIFYISLKFRPEYVEETKSDAYGERMFYYYNPELIRELAGDQFTTVFESSQTIGSTDWFTIALRRRG